jgi:hypothetical protein
VLSPRRIPRRSREKLLKLITKYVYLFMRIYKFSPLFLQRRHGEEEAEAAVGRKKAYASSLTRVDRNANGPKQMVRLLRS